MLEAFPPGGRDRRLVSAILILAAIVLTFLAISLTADGDLLLRRHAAHVLPGVAARIHHQPDRHPHRRRHPASAARGCDGPRLHGDRGGARLPDPRRRPGAVELDQPVRRVAAEHPREHGRDRRADAGLARLDRARRRSTWRRRPWRSSTTSTRSPGSSSSRSSRSRSPASARSGRCSSSSSCRSTWSSIATRSWPSSSGWCRPRTRRRHGCSRRRPPARSGASCAASR